MTTTITDPVAPQTTEFVPAPASLEVAPLYPTLTIGRVALKEALAQVGRAIGKNSLPVLSTVLLRATAEGTLILTATDLSLGITIQIAASSRDEWAVCIPSKLLADIVGAFPGEMITIEQVRSDTIRLISSNFETTLNGIDAVEFPSLPIVDGTTFAIPGKTCIHAIESVAPFAASDSTRPVLKGVRVRLTGHEASFTAADGFRLARITIPLELNLTTDIVIPADALAEIAALFKALDGPVSVTIAADRNTVVFQAGGITAITRVMEGGYPDADRIIPASGQYQTNATLKTAELANALKLAGYFASSSAPASRASIEPAALTLTANAASVGDQRAEVDATCSGPSMQVAFNTKFATQIIQVVDTATLTIEVTSPKHPIVIRPVGDEQAVFILMPMTVH